MAKRNVRKKRFYRPEEWKYLPNVPRYKASELQASGPYPALAPPSLGYAKRGSVTKLFRGRG